MTTIELTSIKGAIVTFCATDDFKSYVRRAINDEMFWRDVLQHVQVESKVNSHLSDKVPGMVKSKVKDMVPGLVATELTNRLPPLLKSYLDDSVSMKNILDEHSGRLNRELEDHARKHLERIVNEDHYHEVNKKYFDAFEKRGTDAIGVFNNKGDTSIAETKKKYEKELEEYRSQMGQVARYQERTNSLESEVRNLRILSIVEGVLLGAGVLYCILRR